MTRCLIDTNILVRMVSPHDPLKPVAVGAVDRLRRRQDLLSVAPQTLMEFWAVATRPRDNNGLGLAPDAAAQEVDRFAENFPLVPGATRRNTSREIPQSFQAAPRVQVPPFALTALAYYRADAPYLTVEKCADRCRRLSQLLSAALGHNSCL